MMTDVIPVSLDNGLVIYVEKGDAAFAPVVAGIHEAGAAEAAEKVIDTASQLTRSIRGFCAQMIDSLQGLEETARPDRATIEFGLSVSLEGNVYVVKTSGAASIKVTAQWDLSA
jgi:hypothetical protein